MKILFLDWKSASGDLTVLTSMAAKVNTLSSGEKPKRKQWSSESMEAAVKFVRDGMGLKEASRLYNLPVETLRRRVIGAVDIHCRPGPPTVLTEEEEKKLSDYIVKMADIGFGLGREDLRMAAFRIADKSGRPHPFHNGMAGVAWLDGFFIRHPKLVLRTAQPLSYSRAVSASHETIQDYFAKLAAMYARLNILSKPMQIFNTDEIGVFVVHKPGKVITEMGRKCVWSISSAEKGKNHTILSCVSAAGFSLPPFMVYPRKRISEALKVGAYPGTCFTCSDKGWITQEVYVEWFRFFLKTIPPIRPILLIADGHSSHVSMEVIELACDNNVHLLCLPSHTTHLLQPLDVGIFKSLKSHYNKECKKYMAAHPGQMVTTEVIASLIGRAWSLSFTPVNIMAGFRKSGAYPLNPGVIDDRQVAPSLAVNPCNRVSVTGVKNCPSSESSASDSLVSNFSADQEALFRRRYEEGYDLPDPVYRQWLSVNHPEDTKSSGSMVTHVSDSQMVHSSSTASDVVSEVLKLPEPQLPKRKRKPGFNTGKAVTITDTSFITELRDKEEEKKAKEIEKQRRKEGQKEKRKEAIAEKKKWEKRRNEKLKEREKEVQKESE